MKRLIHRLPLITGCLFLAWVLILLMQNVSETYGRAAYTSKYLSEYVSEDITEYASGENEEDITGYASGDISAWWKAWLTENGNSSSFTERCGRGLCYIVDSFIYKYNECGYYDSRLSYTGIGWVERGEVQCGFTVLYLFLAFMMLVPLLIGEFTGQVYVLTGGVLALILLLGEVPKYGHLMLLIAGWIYMNLVKHWMKMKGENNFREFLQEFPFILVPCYLFLALVVMLLPVLMPADRLPEADMETKKMIFTRLQDIQLVSDQYEEKQRLKQQENRNRENDAETGNTEQETDGFPETETWQQGTEENQMENREDWPETEANQWLSQNGQEQNGQMQENEPGTDSSSDSDSDFEFNQEKGSYLIGNKLGITGTNGLGFSLNAGGGVSGGRTDRTENLSFRGKMVLKATMNSKPEEDLYIRLFYAEYYHENRWKQTGENAASELSVNAFYSLQDGGGDSGIEDKDLSLAYVDDLSKNVILGSSKLISAGVYEADEYLYNTCQEVPEELEKLFADRFPDVFQGKMETLSKGEMISEIRQVLDEAAYYTLSPGNVPKNEDFITWFLTENKKGYCMHFASAGVMMLREAGFCSRYAEGYFIPESAWVEQEDGSWCAEVMDSNAHAWAEIYQEDGLEDLAGCWLPVELTPSYDGELAGSFAGQPDIYAGRFVIPAGIIWAARMIFRIACIVFLTAVVLVVFRKAKSWREYRMLHTGDERQDIRNMMKLLLQRLVMKNSRVRKILKENNLTREEINDRIIVLVPELSQDREAAEWFQKFSSCAYRAAFDMNIDKKDRKEAYFLYRRLKKKLNVKKEIKRKRRYKKR